MTRRAITQADLNAARRITPTGYAEEAYQARKRLPMIKTPSGLLLPQPRAEYRKTIDGPLLVNIAKKAYADWSAEQLPKSAGEVVAAALAEDIRRRFPDEAMAVLAQYDAAHPVSHIIVDLTGEHYEKPVHLDLPEPVIAPARAGHFALTEKGQGAPVPDAQRGFFQRVLDVRAAQRADFTDAISWPGQFWLRHKRAAKWFEIEKAWPLIGAWMAEQRRAS